MEESDSAETIQRLPVFAAETVRCVDGVAEGDAISFADELVMDDVYWLAEGATPREISVEVGPSSPFRIAAGSRTGQPGRPLYLDALVTFMAPDGATFEAVILVEVEGGAAEAVYLMPLAAMAPRTDYRLVGLDRQTATTRFAQAAWVSFTRGTHITLASGEQRRVEDLKVGDRVLTRDDGAQPIRWIGASTLRAVGAFAPVLIRKGALHNANDLILSPDHRIFVYQREDRLGAGRSEVLIKVRHLINGTTVVQQEGGFVDYFQILFDDHQIIYAEGIAAESLLIDPRTREALPGDLRAKLGGARGHATRHHMDYEVAEPLLAGADAVELLRRASAS